MPHTKNPGPGPPCSSVRDPNASSIEILNLHPFSIAWYVVTPTAIHASLKTPLFSLRAKSKDASRPLSTKPKDASRSLLTIYGKQQVGGARLRDAKAVGYVGVGAEAQVQPPRSVKRARYGPS